jgi:hypothetical protein
VLSSDTEEALELLSLSLGHGARLPVATCFSIRPKPMIWPRAFMLH